jgi:competence protein ComEC
LAGFLVGETSQLTDTDVEALRRAGISHFIAVSGANVAGFLLVWWILLGPLGVGPRRRGVWGLLAIAVFVVATRWQPSVIRASLMAGLVLTGRVVGIPIDAWSALGVAGSLALLISPELASNLGFQLSVLATAGIMLGFDPFPPSVPVIVRRPLAATLSAQAAVTPLLLAEFGSVPLASPLTNLLAAPLVASSTLLGGVGALSGVDLALDIGLRLSALVLDLARWASWLPQIGVMAFAGLTVLLVAFRWPRSRPIAVLAAAIALVIAWVPSPAVARPAAVFLDVGQGDATLLLASGGANLLIDGGPDQVLLMEALRRYQIRQLDLVVVTHPHNDHLLGLVGLTERVSISRIWYGGDHHHNDNWDLIRGEAASRGVVVAQPSAGSRYQLGDLQIDVLGPRRRYDGPNDESIVLLVTVGQTTVFMTGDAEVAAQRDIPPPDVDVLKTPHQGANTSSLSWLAAVNPELAVISVGANDYGHPSPLVVSTLEQTGATVIRTDQHGDVIVPLGAETITWPATAASGPTP